MCTDVDPLNEPRDAAEYDVVIVGGGPAGLSSAIRLRQLAMENDLELSVAVLEKGHEIGAHVLSGNVFEPHALEELIPDWREKGAPLETEAKDDSMRFMLSESQSVPLPVPPMLHNEGNYIVSLGQVCRWLGEQAEELGVEVYPGTAISEVVYDDAGAVKGVATRDQGIAKDGTPKDSFVRGFELHGQQVILAEGCRGSCSEEVMEKFNLRADCDDQIYGLGIKEVWRVDPEKCRPGTIQHSVGWPLDSKTYGGSFLYHMAPDKILLGFVVGLDYENPYLSPYKEMQRWKHHPDVLKHIEGGECIQYGARCINEGGLQSIPKLSFPGGLLAGCSAGFLNVPKIKGTHTAMKSGMVAAEEAFAAIKDTVGQGLQEEQVEVTSYQKAMEDSWVWDELKAVRNYKPAFEKGLYAGLAYSGVSAFVLRGNEPWTFNHSHKDSECTKPAAECAPIEYPQPDGKISFDLLSSLQLSATDHDHDQPAHLRIKEGMEDVPTDVSYKVYGGPEQRFCPAGVYEYPNDDGKLVINAQNCVHCKCCSIKMPQEYIRWTVPQGGEGPAYEMM